MKDVQMRNTLLDIIRKCEQVRELREVRDRCVTSILNKEESYTIIEFLSTY